MQKRVEQFLEVRGKKTLDSVFHLTTAWPKTILALFLAVTALATIYTLRHMELLTGRMEMISSEKRYVQLDEQYSNEFRNLDPLIVAVEPRDVEQGKRFVSELGETLKQDTAHVQEVFYRIDTSSLEGKKLLYLSPEDIETLNDNLEDNSDLVRELVESPGLNTMFDAINRQVSSGMVSYIVSGLLGDDADEGEEKKPIRMEFLNSLLLEMSRALASPDYGYRSPWADFFGGDEKFSDEGYLISENRQLLFLMVEPQESGESGFTSRRDSIAAVRGAVAARMPQFPGLTAGVTGQKALNNDEMLSAESDTNVATVVSFVGVTLLYLLFFRNLRQPLVIAFALLLGLAWTMGFAALTVGHLTIMTVFVAPMLLGLADDFAVHFVARFQEERAGGRTVRESLRLVFEHTVPGIVAGAFTTSIAFFAVMLTDFRGVQELGWISGAGLILYFITTVTCLPALLVWVEGWWPWKPAREDKGGDGPTLVAAAFGRFGDLIVRARWPILAAALLATAASLWAAPKIAFDYNLLNLQARGVESVKWEKRILKDSERSSWRALAAAASLDETTRKAAAFEARPSVEDVESIAMMIPKEQERRIELVRSLKPLLQDFPQEIGSVTSADVGSLKTTLGKLRFKIRSGNEQWDPKKKPPETELELARTRLGEVVDRLKAMPEEEAGKALASFQASLFADFEDKWALLRNNLDPQGPITLADVPEQLKERWISRDGSKFLLQIYPRKSIWDREPMEEFVGELRQVDPDVVGSPIIGLETIRAMKDGYAEAGIYAFVAVLIVTFLTLRRVGDTLLAFVPLGLGMAWTLGAMRLFGLQFNLANLIVVPLIIGIGLENGIHMVHRFREEGEGGARLAASGTGQSVALFNLTTIVGFGSLMVAKYYGIFSIGLLLTLSVGSVLVASLTILPLLAYRPVRRGCR
ncbi:MAG: MMPL family transporter [bacterium]